MITGPFKTLPVTITDPDLLATTQRLLDARLLHQIHNGDCLAITHNGLDILYQYAFVKKDYWPELSFQFKWDHVLRLLNRYQSVAPSRHQGRSGRFERGARFAFSRPNYPKTVG